MNDELDLYISFTFQVIGFAVMLLLKDLLYAALVCLRRHVMLRRDQ